MNLDQTFCACDCINVKCSKQLSYGVVCAAEARNIDPETLKWEDMSANCPDYMKKEETDV